MRYRMFGSTSLVAAAVMVLVTACGDDPVRPDGFLDLAEAEAFLESAAGLPSVARLAERAAAVDPAQRAVLLRAREVWADGAAGARPGGTAHRVASAREAAPVLAALLGPEEWGPVRRALEEWSGTAERGMRHLDLPAVRTRLHSARAHLALADGATRHDVRVYHLLAALADLVETTPRFVARALVDDAAAALGRAAAADGANEGPSLDRARRLSMWAARALEEEDYLRAIQRAYYALQLVEMQ